MIEMMGKNKLWFVCAGAMLALGATACADNNSDGDPENNQTAGNNQTANNQSSNNTTTANNATTGNNATSGNNQTAGNNTTVGNNTTAGNNQTSPANNATTPMNNNAMCMDVTVYVDADGDGFGSETDGTMMACLTADEQPTDGYAREAGDCKETDPIAYSGAEGVCGDNVDDNCDGEDEACPTSQPANLDIPDWDCQGAAPDNVYAYARFDDGKGYLADGGCFVFFEGAPGAFYSQRVGIEPAAADCTGRYGCVCPSEGGWPSYDRRLYALTLAGAPDDCEQLELIDHAGEEQPVSNSCRKYLYQLHRYEIPFSHVASSMDALTRRLENFPTVEVACLRDAPHANLPFRSLLTADIQLNEGYTPK